MSVVKRALTHVMELWPLPTLTSPGYLTSPGSPAGQQGEQKWAGAKVPKGKRSSWVRGERGLKPPPQSYRCFSGFRTRPGTCTSAHTPPVLRQGWPPARLPASAPRAYVMRPPARILAQKGLRARSGRCAGL